MRKLATCIAAATLVVGFASEAQATTVVLVECQVKSGAFTVQAVTADDAGTAVTAAPTLFTEDDCAALLRLLFEAGFKTFEINPVSAGNGIIYTVAM